MRTTRSTQSFTNSASARSSMEATNLNQPEISLTQKIVKTVSSVAARLFSKDSTHLSTPTPPSVSRLSRSTTSPSSFPDAQVNQLIHSVKETKQDNENLNEPEEGELAENRATLFTSSQVLKQSAHQQRENLSIIPADHQVQVISSPKFYMVEYSRNDNQNSQMNQNKTTSLPQEEVLIEFLNKEGAKYFLQAKNNNRTQLIKFENRSLIFTPSGKVYFSLEDLGSGNFKTTSKTVLIASIVFEQAKETKSKVRAFSVTSETANSTTQSEKSLQNEIKINIYIREQFKHLKLTSNSNSILSNVCVAKSVKNVNTSQVGIMSELCDGDMETYLDNHYSHSREDFYFFMSEMAKGVGQLHSLNIVHRDLKPDNFLYIKNEQGEIVKIKIADFGLSSRLEESDRYESTIFPLYFADPQWFLKPNYENAPQFDKQSDIYQLGVCFYQILQGYGIGDLEIFFKDDVKALQRENPNLKNESFLNVLRIVKQNPKEWRGMSTIAEPEVINMLLRMLDSDPQNRPTIQEVEKFFLQKSRELKSKNNANKKTKKTTTPSTSTKIQAKPGGYVIESNAW